VENNVPILLQIHLGIR